MARIRSIKPEFWTSAQVMECSTNARLLFIGLWNFCDDAGRMVLSCKRIKAQVFPSDDFSSDAVRRMIDELSTNGLVATYLVEDKEYLVVTGWHHQKIDRPRSSDLPPPPDGHSSTDRRTFDAGVEGKGREGKEEAQLGAGAREDDPEGLPANPLPETSPDRRQQLDRLEASLRSAAGLEQADQPGLMNLAPILGIIDAGADLNLDILPTLRAKARGGVKARSWAFFVPAIEEAANARKASASRAVPAAPRGTPPDVWQLWVKGYRDKRSWLPALGPEPDKPDCLAPAEILAAHGFTRSGDIAHA